MSTRVLAVCAAAAGLAVAPSIAAEAQGARAAVEAANGKFSSAFAAGKAADVAAHYSADAQAFPPNGDIVAGRAAIQNLWQGVMDSGVKGVKLTTLELTPRGDIAYEVGKYELAGQGGNVLDRGKYVVVWKRESGRWKIHRDIWNTSMPAAK
jgi:ketosteroid isomerase-like protein